MTKWAPTVTPFVMMEQYRETWAVYLPMTEVMPDWKADAIMFARAKGTILSSPAVFTRYVAWSAIDCWRLLAFASPLSPGFPIEAMFNVQAAAGPLSMAQVLILVVAHVIEWIWVIGTLIGLVLGFRAYGLKFVPGWIVGYTVFFYAPTDDAVRFGAPFTPWRVVCLVILIITLLRMRERKKGMP
jgi:hypothetical protein